MPFAIAVVASVVLIAALRPVAGRMRLVDRPSPGELKIHRSAVPVVGGIGVVLAAVAGSIAGNALPLAAGLAAITLMLGLGLVDDIRPLPAWVRIALQAAAGVLVGLAVAPGDPAIVAIAVAVALGLVNGLNLIDGQDGLAGVVAAITAVGLAVVLARQGSDDAATGAALAGAAIGFLAWNLPPARVFLGNGGAYAVGIWLALLSVPLIDEGGMLGAVVTATMLAPVALEVIFTLGRRALRGGKMFAGDRHHSYDLIARLTDRTTSTVIFGLAAALCVAAGVVGHSAGPTAAWIIAAIVYVVGAGAMAGLLGAVTRSDARAGRR